MAGGPGEDEIRLDRTIGPSTDLVQLIDQFAGVPTVILGVFFGDSLRNTWHGDAPFDAWYHREDWSISLLGHLRSLAMRALSQAIFPHVHPLLSVYPHIAPRTSTNGIYSETCSSRDRPEGRGPNEHGHFVVRGSSSRSCCKHL